MQCGLTIVVTSIADWGKSLYSVHHCSQVEMATENKSLPELQRELEILQMNSDNFFLIVNGIIIFLMQAGFAFLEAGAVRLVVIVIPRHNQVNCNFYITFIISIAEPRTRSTY